MLAMLFLFTVLAGLAGAVWELVGVSRLLVKEHPEESQGVPYPALTRKIDATQTDPEWPAGMDLRSGFEADPLRSHPVSPSASRPALHGQLLATTPSA